MFFLTRANIKCLERLFFLYKILAINQIVSISLSPTSMFEMIGLAISVLTYPRKSISSKLTILIKIVQIVE